MDAEATLVRSIERQGRGWCCYSQLEDLDECISSDDALFEDKFVKA
jgi:hypothetical protein